VVKRERQRAASKPMGGAPSHWSPHLAVRGSGLFDYFDLFLNIPCKGIRPMSHDYQRRYERSRVFCLAILLVMSSLRLQQGFRREEIIYGN
jgi:hypothetical protein